MTKNSSSLMMDIGNGLFLMVGLPRLPFWDNKTRPKKAERGTFGFNFQTNSLEYYNGSDWFRASLLKT